eukprot:Rhum_TRINITY_DN14196_c2_g2::Rhum_TRINITY_DN14196_c2_g2_i1::g.72058::m.72058
MADAPAVLDRHTVLLRRLRPVHDRRQTLPQRAVVRRPRHLVGQDEDAAALPCVEVRRVADGAVVAADGLVALHAHPHRLPVERGRGRALRKLRAEHGAAHAAGVDPVALGVEGQVDGGRRTVEAGDTHRHNVGAAETDADSVAHAARAAASHEDDAVTLGAAEGVGVDVRRQHEEDLLDVRHLGGVLLAPRARPPAADDGHSVAAQLLFSLRDGLGRAAFDHGLLLEEGGKAEVLRHAGRCRRRGLCCRGGHCYSSFFLNSGWLLLFIGSKKVFFACFDLVLCIYMFGYSLSLFATKEREIGNAAIIPTIKE